MSQPQRLSDLFDLPTSVHPGDFVLELGRDDQPEKVLNDYVVTEDLADRFRTALELIEQAVTGNSSKGTYLDGSFGSGKSHFMAVLREILRHNPAARGKHRLVDAIVAHDNWLQNKRFLQVSLHMIDEDSLEDAVLGGYVKAIQELHPEAALPAVYRDGMLLNNALLLREKLGDEAFVSGLPSSAAAEADEWGDDLAGTWDSETLDAAFSAPPGDTARTELVSALMKSYFSHFTGYTQGENSYLKLDQGLSVISHHAKHLGYDAVVLYLDELVLWQSKFVGEPSKLKNEAQKVSKLVESAEAKRPAPIISFLPRQRDLRELVGRDIAGTDTESLFDTLKYWDGRFGTISLADTNLPAVVSERLLKPKDDAAAGALADAFDRTKSNRREVWDILLDSEGGRATVDDFAATYPFSPAFMHTIVDVSSALQRERTALKLLMQLLVDHRDMPLGQLMPVGTIFEVLIDGQDKPFTDRLRDEYNRIKEFYLDELRPWLLDRHKLKTEAEVRDLSPKHAFRADDMVVKTLMLSALVPRVPALGHLTASRLAALNQGAIASPIPGAEKQKVAKTLKDLGVTFSAFRITGSDDPQVTIQLLQVDVKSIIRSAASKSGDKPPENRLALKRLLWEELGLRDPDERITTTDVTWRGTTRSVEILFTNIRETAQVDLYSEEPDRIRLVIDYPFDEGASFSPTEARLVIEEAQKNFSGTAPLAAGMIPAFFTAERQADLAKYVTIRYLLEREERLIEASPNLSGEDRAEARIALNSQQIALKERILSATKQAYGVNQDQPTDVDDHPQGRDRVLGLDQRWHYQLQPGSSLSDSMADIVKSLLDHAYPDHPDLGSGARGRTRAYKRAELDIVLRTVETAVKDPNRRAEITKDDREVLRRIAGPLDLGTVNEGSMILPDRWRRDINTRAEATGHPESLTVAQIRDWVMEKHPGLPGDLRDLVVLCYAIEDDRTWMRSGTTIEAPGLTGLAADMRLCKQPLPERETFDRASQRAVKIFGAEPRPAYNSRALVSMTKHMRLVLHEKQQAVENLHAALLARKTTLGLDEQSPRLVTATELKELFISLSEAEGDLDLFERLAAPELTRDAGIYVRSIRDAAVLAGVLNNETNTWTILDPLVTDTSPEAVKILNRLRQAAEKDQHDAPLEPVIRDCVTAATNRLVKARPPTPPSPPDQAKAAAPGQSEPTQPGVITRRASAGQLKSAFPDLSDELDDGEYDVTFMKVERQ
ncbi:DUF6079 family protein [Natronoglycomyces albus]|uniref:Phage resistance protein n=1 Tax=Natronoglycomyces albus TaxID=2811108 RepID=A0A895XSB2_9ACTN|nr:DUF6079 family protein [Natronoglycomyces albus]QSB05150.1 hypothetical protein JQS30_15555 [Natronoglycomyces albus]